MAICNGSDVAGCNQVPPTVPTGTNSIRLAVDPLTHVVYTANFSDSSLSLLWNCRGEVRDALAEADRVVREVDDLVLRLS